MTHLTTEVLIIGCGIAGGTTALELADRGVPVTVITRAPQPTESNTFYAQGGIIYMGHNDTPGLLADDIRRAGAGYCDPNSVNILAEQGPGLVENILFDRVGVPFDQNCTGPALAREGGHSLARIIHAADATGKAIATALVDALQAHPNVTLLTNYTAIDLLESSRHLADPPPVTKPTRCLGAYLLDRETGRVVPCFAAATVLATGGLGQVYLRTSNPPGARGDGVGMAHRAGARISDMEFVQFHPTTFHHPEARAFLITEAVRGAGGRLVNANGEPFMQTYAPEWKDLAPRDIVTRSIHYEMLAQGVPNVYLDLASYIPEAEILSHFPTIYEFCRSYGIDITRDLVPVAPAAHYACGGVWVDDWSQTSLPGLFAVGEVACTGLHGANRLASTSLLEGLVWGYRTASYLTEQAILPGRVDPVEVLPYEDGGTADVTSAHIEQRLTNIKQLMWQHVGVVREIPCLEHAQTELARLDCEINQLYHHHRLTDELTGLRNVVQVALLITDAALIGESAGCHYRI